MDNPASEVNDSFLQEKETNIEKLDDILPEINEDIFLYNNNDSKFMEISEISDSIIIKDNIPIIKDSDSNFEYEKNSYENFKGNGEKMNTEDFMTNANLAKTKLHLEDPDISLEEDVVKSENFLYTHHNNILKMKDNSLANNFNSNDTHEKLNKSCANNKATHSFNYFIHKQLFPTYYCPDTNDTSYAKKCQKVSTLFKIPYELEVFSAYGLLQCTNSFLQLFTFLPIRFIIANSRILLIFFITILKALKKPFVNNKSHTHTIKSSKFFTAPINSSEVCDFIKGYLLLISALAFYMIDTSIIYHMVRGQAIIKLYIFFNMLEVADRLCNSLGQDILESLYWAASIASFAPNVECIGRRKHRGLVMHFVLALIYLFIHSFVILLQATTLSVAFNSHNKALLTIMISNNFVELKGNVFKKFEKANLFQMSCSDVRERFNLVIMMGIVMLRNLTEFSWSSEHFFQLFPDMVIVIVAEMAVDWVKHAFITKFNEIPHEVYQEFTTYLAKDVIGNHIIPCPSEKNIHPKDFETVGGQPSSEIGDERGDQNVDHKAADGVDKGIKASKVSLSIFTDNNCDLVCKQTGFTPLPLAVIFIKTMCQTFNASYTTFKATAGSPTHKGETFLDFTLSHLHRLGVLLTAYYPNINIFNIVIFVLIYINLFLVKIWISILVLGLAYEITSKLSAH